MDSQDDNIKQILFIDDNLDTLQLVGLMLQNQGYQILTASSGEQGLELAFQYIPDLIILDIMMPHMNGYEVLLGIRSNIKTASIPILMLTALTQLEKQADAFIAGADDYLVKSVKPLELFEHVRSLITQGINVKDRKDQLDKINKSLEFNKKYKIVKGARILIIDDDVETTRLVRMMLEKQGYQISTECGGSKGLARALAEQPDLILLDVMMPDMDGYEVTRRLRNNLSTRSTPILMFTAKTQLDDKVTGYEAGADDYLTKPTHPTELQTHIKALLTRKRLKII